MKCRNPNCERKAVAWFGWQSESGLVKAPFCGACRNLAKSLGNKLVRLEGMKKRESNQAS